MEKANNTIDFQQKLEMPQILNSHIARLLEHITYGRCSETTLGVEALRATLGPYSCEDEKYKTALEQINIDFAKPDIYKKYGMVYKLTLVDQREQENQKRAVEFYKSIKIYEELLKLADRYGLLLQYKRRTG